MKRVLLGTAACFSLLFQGAAAQAQDAVSDVAPALAVAVEDPKELSGPALWMLADEDTTIYLFGTVHALPREVKWRVGPVEQALEYSSTLVTEIPGDAITDPSSQQMIAAKAMLSGNKTMRDLLDADQRVSYETAMSKLGLPVDAFDRFEPWFAGMTLAMLPLLKAGYDMDSGVEKVIEKDLSPQVTRDALETIGFQIDMFDQLPMQSQISFLMSSAENIESVSPMMDKMVAEWMEGDADGLAALLNEGLTDPVLTNILLYNRNAKWAEWIDNRMDKPGAVFVAVGAGHLAGEKSVQYYLTQRGFRVERVQ
ncbi:TraB/GumN family protein [Qipengyuania soli]|uniref:TraB/GumN family protein n=1 Tax=Qipengyuania soli TaxID=2782568 RepID=A0A7S8F6L7_9SPHN|nr:TraB/GumN family protein [Qipengyuania soli]QPC99958.1 TraB/GumN family protein [Qipengyuania soli]